LFGVYEHWLCASNRTDELNPRLEQKLQQYKESVKQATFEEKVNALKTVQIQINAFEGESTKPLKPLFPMLKCFQADIKDRPQITRHDVIKDRAWMLKNVLTKSECDEIIKATESCTYELAETYCFLYRNRNNDRLMCEDTQLAEIVFKRVLPFLPSTIQHQKKPWQVTNLNNRWRFCKYETGHYFGAHIDGSFQASSTQTSILTLMIYLNTQKSDFTGGSTWFLSGDYRPTHEVCAEAGLVLIFYQDADDLLHEGARLDSGVKYIMRTDVMYMQT